MTAMQLEALIRRAANAIGLDLTRHRPERTDAGRLSAMLSHHRIDVVLDVGANRGQFAGGLRRAGYLGDILSFEPLSTAHSELVRRSSGDKRWNVAARTAVGASVGMVTMQVAGNSVSSSPLKMLARHADAAPESAIIATESAPIDTLDRLALPTLGGDAKVFVKIDTQGYEDRVLDGAPATLARARGVQLEMSLVPLYEDQVLFDEMIERIRSLGFTTWAIWPAFFDPATGRLLQVDVTFFREPTAP